VREAVAGDIDGTGDPQLIHHCGVLKLQQYRRRLCAKFIRVAETILKRCCAFLTNGPAKLIDENGRKNRNDWSNFYERHRCKPGREPYGGQSDRHGRRFG
jgi:hypothetical protein